VCVCVCVFGELCSSAIYEDMERCMRNTLYEVCVCVCVCGELCSSAIYEDMERCMRDTLYEMYVCVCSSTVCSNVV